MAKTKERIFDTADTMRPYVDRALHDEELRDNLKEAFGAARAIYDDLLGNRGALGAAQRIAHDEDIQDNLRKAVDELREAGSRLRGEQDHSTRNRMFLFLGIVLGVLFNPWTGPATRKWLSDTITGGDDDYSYTPPSSSTNAGSTVNSTSGSGAGSASSDS